MPVQFIYCVTHLNTLLTTYVMSTFAHINGLDKFNQRLG